jgi:hypothetical protein
MFFRGNETITIKRRTISGVDDYGNEAYTTSDIVIRECLLGFGETSEPIDASRQPIDASVTLYMPNGTLILEDDRFVVRGSEFVKEGDPLNWQSPFSNWSLGVVVKVRKRVG